ncbi:hypothetical protein DYI24_00260 [Rhodopseudomonas sp. BR0C11]|uniref:hypothetical protein n=1 Tax=Rhodopseudomonas sp. BR0C11 TaxID=2269370 RepID=UPI0013DE9440|nr:hypothetical protein [Rhodopseudomonas sp. BR0C11]NEV75514.1 hypothetical protein [Rhodopseudomonas sp. BR0C11]
MTNTPSAQNEFEPARRRAPAGDESKIREVDDARTLIAEESFDALIVLLVETELVPRSSIAGMLDKLSARLMLHASCRTNSRRAHRERELIERAGRIAALAASYRDARTWLA